MSRIVIGMLVAATAGVLGWWANHRASASRQPTALAATQPTRLDGPATPSLDDKMIVVPQGNIDPHMVRTMPDVDPKMIIMPPWPPKPPSDTPAAEGH